MKSLRWPSFCVLLSTITALAFSISSAFACSLSADYKGPETNFELVQQADTILVGTLVKSIGNDEYDRKILVKPTLLLKGDVLPKTIEINGYLSDRTIEIEGKRIRIQAKESEQFDLWRPHPEVWMGGCSRNTFDQGMQVVLFFEKVGDKLQWFDPPFTRGSEDVSGPDALWVRAVKIYARIARLPAAEQKAALFREMKTLRQDSSRGRDRELLADDIERQLAGVRTGAIFEIPDRETDEGQDEQPSARWVNNIFNGMYEFSALSGEMKSVPRQVPEKTGWLTGFIAGLFTASIVFGFFMLIRKRSKRISLASSGPS